MIKRIRREQLKPGMFIHDLNCSWMAHPFLLNSFLLQDEKTIEEMAGYGIHELFIDTSKGLDVEGAQTQEEFDSEIHDRFTRHTEALPNRGGPVPTLSLRDEIVVAKDLQRDANQVVHRVLMDARLGRQLEVGKLEPMVERIADSILRNPDALISLSRIKTKDNYTFEHSVSVCVLLVAFCQTMGYERSVMIDIGVGGLLHDVGKMMIPDGILNKPGALTPPEFMLMQSHAHIGAEMLKQTPGIPEIAIVIAAQHHERFDGTGYPDRLKEDRISRFGQMASIVDVYDALTSNRIYHQSIEPTAAMKKLFEWGKSHFNEELVHHFIRAIGIYPVGSLVRLESGLLGVVVEPDGADLLHPTVRVVYDMARGSYVSPHDLVLSKQAAGAASDKIVGHESPRKWHIDPYAYLQPA